MEVPLCSSLINSIFSEGPSSLTRFLQINRPRPVPCLFCISLVENVANILNNLGLTSSDIPQPVSVIVIL